MDYWVLAIMASGGFGATHIFNKRLLASVQSPLRVVWYTNTYQLVFVLLAVLLTRNVQLPPPATWPYLLLAGIVGVGALVALFTGLRHHQVAHVLTIANTFPLVTLLLSRLAYHTALHRTMLCGMVIIFLGLGLLIRQGTHLFRFNRAALCGGLTAIGWGSYSFLIFHIERLGLNPYMTMLMIEAMILLLALGLLMFRREPIDSPFQRSYRIAAASGSLLAIGTIAYGLALNAGHPALVSSIVSANPILAALLANRLLKEQLSLRQWIGVIAVIIGVIALGSKPSPVVLNQTTPVQSVDSAAPENISPDSASDPRTSPSARPYGSEWSF